MNVDEFRKTIQLESIIQINDQDYKIDELVKFKFDDGSYYTKLYLKNGFVFADDDENNMFLLVEPIKTEFKPPYVKTLEFHGKKFNFLYSAHATAEETKGKQIFPQGNSEGFWDYMSEDGSYLSLGIDDQSKEKVDFYGKIIKPEQVSLKE